MVGMDASATSKSKDTGYVSKTTKRHAKRKEKKKQTDSDTDAVCDVLADCSINDQTANVTQPATELSPTTDVSAADPAKRIRTLKKKLRQIDELKAKIDSGDIKPDKVQLEKVSKRLIIIKEIEDLELELVS